MSAFREFEDWLNDAELNNEDPEIRTNILDKVARMIDTEEHRLGRDVAAGRRYFSENELMNIAIIYLKKSFNAKDLEQFLLIFSKKNADGTSEITAEKLWDAMTKAEIQE